MADAFQVSTYGRYFQDGNRVAAVRAIVETVGVADFDPVAQAFFELGVTPTELVSAIVTQSELRSAPAVTD
jgi:hypothetical protein